MRMENERERGSVRVQERGREDEIESEEGE